MSLQMIAGSSGAGKSYTVYQELIRASMAHPERTYLVIVPEQFTMQTQKDLVVMHPRHGLINLDVLSFNRLAWRVFEEVGGNQYPVLDDLGKTLILQKTVSDLTRQMQVLGGTLRRTGSVEEMKSLISELMQYRVRPEDLEEWIDGLSGGSGLLRHKLQDVRLVYERFLTYLDKRYVTAEELPERLCEVLDRSALVRDAVIVLDGFTGFTPVQMLVVRKLMCLAASVSVIVTADARTALTGKNGQQDLFYMSSRMTGQLFQCAREEGCEILPVRRIGAEHGRFRENAPLAFLEENLFRYRSAAYPEEQQKVQLLCGADPREELAFITSEITRLVREEGYRYRDVALITGDPETYGREAARQMELAGIPFFLDQKRSLLANPLVEFLRASVDMVRRGFTCDSVFRTLRSGMTGFSPEEVDRMENYCLAVGIRGWKQYQERWVRLPRYLAPEEIEPLNALRERFVEQFAAFTDGMRARGGTMRHKTEVLYRLMELQRLQQKTAAFEQMAEAAGDPGKGREYAQAYGLVIGLLDRMVEALGEERMSMEAFQGILEAGFAELRVGLIPPGEDQVMIGDIERTRLKHIRVLFLAGVNEGVIPRASGGDGILSEADRRLLEAQQIELAPKGRALMYQQRFYLYLALTKPRDRLYLSFSETSPDGSALMPSYLAAQILRLYPQMEVRPLSARSVRHRMETPEGVREALVEGIRRTPSPEVAEEAAFLQTLFGGVVQFSGLIGKGQVSDGTAAEPTEDARPEEKVCTGSETSDLLLRMLDAAELHNPDAGLRKETARALYGSALVNSATRLERFSACAFAHFAQYGLHLSEREEYVFTPADLGTILHRALEQFAKELDRRKISWTSLTDEQRDQAADRALEQLVHDYGNTILHSSMRSSYQIERIRRMLRRTVWALQEQLRRGSFVPGGAETGFRGEELEAMRVRLSESEEVLLRGQIDRIDLCERDGTTYVRIIDYKTGATELQLDVLYYGLQIQLPLYMKAAMERIRKTGGTSCEPAGMFYFNIQDPMIETRSEDPDDVQRELLKALRLDGLARAEDEILALLDETTVSGGPAEVLRVSRNKGGDLAKYSSVASREQFAVVQAYTTEMIRETGRRILDGEIKANPYLEGQKHACAWCPYKPVCGFDERIRGYRYRRLKKLDRVEAIDRMREALGESVETP